MSSDPTPLDPSKIAELEAMLAKATPGPWRPCHHLRSPEHDASCPCGYRGGIWGGDESAVVCEMGAAPTPGEEGLDLPRYPRATELVNSALIVALRNTAPSLLAAARDAIAAPAHLEASRSQFEAWASSPPREFSVERYPNDESVSWPGNYKAYYVQCAWEAWCAAARSNAELRESVASLTRERDEARAESAGRLRVLEEKASEARSEWIRAERAEGDRDALAARVKELEAKPSTVTLTGHQHWGYQLLEGLGAFVEAAAKASMPLTTNIQASFNDVDYPILRLWATTDGKHPAARCAELAAERDEARERYRRLVTTFAGDPRVQAMNAGPHSDPA